ncbi:ABC transporter permease [Poseidonocella sedimentorum]|uniref:Transport permease protein n=1 Tax=Poseidonocella sedimentorum TaxID=871652 RepID=A0A1I6ED46_9RHOB|nr:ABC transporter permease [Poseidonocella sedimentorum]SFR15587.1 capsular polysaccharide transport system permease protein [Poseidonocella sedimentorum]
MVQSIPPSPALRPATGRRTLRFRSMRTIFALILREMTTSYGRTPGGYLWAVLEPIAVIAILSVAFSLLLRAPSLGTSFILFYASAVLPLRFFLIIQSSIAGAINFNRGLMAYPRVTVFDSVFARGILALLTQIMVNAIVLWGIFQFEDIREIIDPGPILLAYACSLWLAFGVGMLHAYLTYAFQLYARVWNVSSRPLLLLSGVFYTFEDLPQIARDIFWYNPMIHITGLSRSGYFASYHPEYISLSYVFVFGLIPMFFGALILRRFGKDAIYL